MNFFINLFVHQMRQKNSSKNYVEKNQKGTNWKEQEPKRAQTKKSKNQKEHKPKTARTKKGTNQKQHEPKRDRRN